MYANDIEMEESCKPEHSIKLETNLNKDLSRLRLTETDQHFVNTRG